jgi:hypothetical protein
VGGAREVDQVADRGDSLKEVERVLGVVARNDDPKMDHAG